MLTTHRMTYDDLLATPDDGYRYELVRGEILRMPPPKPNHGCVQAALVGAIDRYLHERALREGWQAPQGRAARNRLVGRLISGEAGIRLSLPTDVDQVRGVDLAYLNPEQVARLAEVPPDAYIPEAPTLLAEIISPSETIGYIDDKLADYFAGGAQQVWLLFPSRRTIRICAPDGSSNTIAPEGILDGGAILPGFSVVLVNLFP